MKKKIRLKSKVSLALEPLDELQDITSTFFKFSFIFFIAAFTCRITNLCSICSVYVVSVHCTPPQTHPIQFRKCNCPQPCRTYNHKTWEIMFALFPRNYLYINFNQRSLVDTFVFLEFNPMWVIDTYVTQYNIWKFYYLISCDFQLLHLYLYTYT